MTTHLLVNLDDIESPLERALHGISLGAADLFIAITEAQTNAECCALAKQIGNLVLTLQAAESAALERADALCGSQS